MVCRWELTEYARTQTRRERERNRESSFCSFDVNFRTAVRTGISVELRPANLELGRRVLIFFHLWGWGGGLRVGRRFRWWVIQWRNNPAVSNLQFIHYVHIDSKARERKHVRHMFFALCCPLGSSLNCHTSRTSKLFCSTPQLSFPFLLCIALNCILKVLMEPSFKYKEREKLLLSTIFPRTLHNETFPPGIKCGWFAVTYL